MTKVYSATFLEDPFGVRAALIQVIERMDAELDTHYSAELALEKAKTLSSDNTKAEALALLIKGLPPSIAEHLAEILEAHDEQPSTAAVSFYGQDTTFRLETGINLLKAFLNVTDLRRDVSRITQWGT